jgi:hypothetical protein
MNALDIRKQWLKLYGLDEDEITQNCKKFPPTDFEEEVKQLTAMFAIQALNEEKNAKAAISNM